MRANVSEDSSMRAFAGDVNQLVAVDRMRFLVPFDCRDYFFGEFESSGNDLRLGNYFPHGLLDWVVRFVRLVVVVAHVRGGRAILNAWR